MPTIPPAPAASLSQGLDAFASHNWYAVAAIVLMLAIQIARSRELALWTHTPNGWRWLWPVGLAGAAAFVHAFALGEALKQAGLDVLNSLWRIALPAMGGAAALKESPLPWDGGSGGKSAAAPERPRPAPSVPPDLHLVPDVIADAGDRPTPVDPAAKPPPPSTPPAA